MGIPTGFSPPRYLSDACIISIFFFSGSRKLTKARGCGDVITIIITFHRSSCRWISTAWSSLGYPIPHALPRSGLTILLLLFFFFSFLVLVYSPVCDISRYVENTRFVGRLIKNLFLLSILPMLLVKKKKDVDGEHILQILKKFFSCE